VVYVGHDGGLGVERSGDTESVREGRRILEMVKLLRRSRQANRLETMMQMLEVQVLGV
jgi:hypothetical protein